MDEKVAVEALRQVKEVLDKYGVEYWLDSGTLLGAVRNGKFIPWDVDIDLGSLETEMEKLSKACIDLQDKGFSAYIGNNIMVEKHIPISIYYYSMNRKNGELMRLTIMERKSMISKVIYRLYLIFFTAYFLRGKPNLYNMSISTLTENLIKHFSKFPSRFLLKITKKMLMLSDKFGYCIRWKMPFKFYNELSTIKFYGMDFKIPSPVEEYLTYRYGEDWKTPKKDWRFYRDDGAIIKNRECNV